MSNDNMIIQAIQVEKAKEIAAEENPALDEEGMAVMGMKRMAIDEPPAAKRADPLR